MGEEHLDLLPELHRDVVLLGPGDVAGDLAGVFVFLAGDGSGIGVRAAFLLRRAGLAGQFQGAVFGDALAGRPPVRVGIVPAELLQLVALGADVLIVLGVPLEVRPGPGAVAAAGLVEDRDVRGDLAVDQPAQHRPGAVGGVRDQAFGMQVEPGLHPLQHGLGRSDLGLPDRPRRLDIHDDTMIRVDQVIVGIAEECRAFAGRRPLAGGIGMRGELGLHLAGRAECGLVQRVEILAHGAGRIGRIDLRSVPVFLRRRVLLVGIRFDQAGIDRHALTADQTFLDAARDGRLEQMPQQLAVAEPAMPVLGKRRVIRDPVAQIEAAEPAIRQVQMHLFAEPPLGPDAEAIADQQHPDQQLGIDGRTARVAVEIRKMGADAAQVDEPINGPQQVILRDMILQRELTEQRPPPPPPPRFPPSNPPTPPRKKE